MVLVVSIGVKYGSKHTERRGGNEAAMPINSGFPGRWDRNRIGALQLWSLLPFVQERSGTYTRGLKMALFNGPMYQEVSQRSPALGSTFGQSGLALLFSLGIVRGAGHLRLP
jgi:hypothetical protein